MRTDMIVRPGEYGNSTGLGDGFAERGYKRNSKYLKGWQKEKEKQNDCIGKITEE